LNLDTVSLCRSLLILGSKGQGSRLWLGSWRRFAFLQIVHIPYSFVCVVIKKICSCVTCTDAAFIAY